MMEASTTRRPATPSTRNWLLEAIEGARGPFTQEIQMQRQVRVGIQVGLVLVQQSAPRELVTAIRQVAAGLKYISPALAQELANHVGEDHEAPPHDTLSDREYQTLTMIASGKTVGMIAKELSLSVKTVSEYRARLLVKMKLKNSAELTHYAIKNQLIE